jgi:phosphate transport system permease protein
MVDMTKLSAHHASEASAQRLKKRHAAEVRLKAYGIAAIATACIALAALVWSVGGKAGGVLFEHYITLETPLPAEEFDPNGDGDPETLRKADYAGHVKDLVRATFPNVKDRRTRKQLNDLISVGASSELREYVMANPDLVGSDVTFSYVASDVVDLYLKGSFGTLKSQSPDGSLKIANDSKTVSVTSDTDDFAPVLAQVKADLSRSEARLTRQLALVNNGVAAFEKRLETAQTDEEKAAVEAEITARIAERDGLQAQIDELVRRAGASDEAETLKRSDPSVLLRLGDQWIKMTEIGPQGGVGTLLGAPIEDGAVEAGGWSYYLLDTPEASRKISDVQVSWVETLRDAGAVDKKLNWRFLSASDSREPELAGILGATVGTFWTMLVTFVLAFPIGMLAAIYLEEFAPKNRLTDLIEVNINNLAAVPSIIFGLLGLSIVIGFFGVPRSAPLVGGIVLALMTLPTIIIASRASIAAVPPSIREAALGVGASQLQTSFHHVLPAALPGVLTGTIIGMARALGETAPLILIGMVAFIVNIPKGINDSATALPVLIFRWADFPERAFEAKTAAAICLLLVFLIFMNALAVFLRKQFERRW